MRRAAPPAATPLGFRASPAATADKARGTSASSGLAAARFAPTIFRQIATLPFGTQNLRRTRDLLLPRLLSGQVNLGEN